MRPLRYRRCVTVREYATEEVIVEWRPRLCYHSQNCVRALPLVFDKERRPWIDPTQATADEVEAAVDRCPSGALRIRRLRGEPLPVPTTVEITPDPNGPLLVRGPDHRREARRHGRGGHAGRVLPVRSVGQQAVLRRQPSRRRLRGMTVRDNPELQRYEAIVDGELAGSIFYRELDDTLILVHTEVEEAFEGQGIGSRLVAATLDDIRARGLRMRPFCPFVKAYLERHPEYDDLIAA